MFLFCFVCSRSSFRGHGYAKDIGPWRLETHEIARGAYRARAIKEPAAWLRVCEGTSGGCHTRLGGCPVVIQLALKKKTDPEHYDRERVNQLRNRAPSAITEAEVDEVAGWLELGETVEGCKKRLLGGPARRTQGKE
jgi:hypothetical protein